VHISFAVFADAANLSQEGKLNVLGIFDALQVGAFPSVHPRAHFILRLKGSANDVGHHMLSFRWLNPRGTELWNSTGELQLEGKQDPVIEVDLPVIAVVDLPLDVAGRYTMQVDLDGQSITHTQLFVTGPAPALPFTGPQKTLVS
jgi:hypothetical protein